MSKQKRILKIMKNAEVISEREYLVEKLSLYQIMQLANIEFKEDFKQLKNNKSKRTAFFLEPENSKLKITFKQVNYEKSLKEFNKSFKAINKKINKFKKKFTIDEPLNGKEVFYQIFINETTHTVDKKCFISVNDNQEMSFKMKYKHNKEVYNY